jgi:hypothetical protein
VRCTVQYSVSGWRGYPRIDPSRRALTCWMRFIHQALFNVQTVAFRTTSTSDSGPQRAACDWDIGPATSSLATSNPRTPRLLREAGGRGLSGHVLRQAELVRAVYLNLHRDFSSLICRIERYCQKTKTKLEQNIVCALIHATVLFACCLRSFSQWCSRTSIETQGADRFLPSLNRFPTAENGNSVRSERSLVLHRFRSEQLSHNTSIVYPTRNAEKLRRWINCPARPDVCERLVVSKQ